MSDKILVGQVERTVSKTVSYSGSVSYPASQNGGSVSYSGSETVYVDVLFNVYFDRAKLRYSRECCEDNIKALSGSILGTQLAQVETKRKTSNHISNTILGGFFGMIGSELSQQITECKSKADSLLMHLRQTSQACVQKKEQMKMDFSRITSRYNKLFDELNSEYTNRIKDLDRSIFVAFKDFQAQMNKIVGVESGAANALSGADQTILESCLLTSNVRRKASDIVDDIKDYVKGQVQMDAQIQHLASLAPAEHTYYYPVISMSSSGVHQLYSHFPLSDDVQVSIRRDLSDSPSWRPIAEDEKEEIDKQMRKYLREKLEGQPDKERILKVFNELKDSHPLQTI